MSDDGNELEAKRERDSQDLMARYKAGERDAFDALQRINDEPVRAYITKKLGRSHKHLVEDASARLWFTVYKKAKKFEVGKGSFKGFLVKIAIYHCKSVKKRRTSKAGNPDRITPEIIETVDSGRERPVASLIALEDERWIEDALSDLTDEERAVLEGLGEEKSYREIGAEIGASHTTVKNLRTRLKDKIKDLLGRRTG